jgi:hypothetical protein
VHTTSRENPTTGAPKRATTGAFCCADDPHVGGNILSLVNLLCAPGIKKTPLTNLLCAPRIKVIPDEQENRFTRDKISKNPKKNYKTS